MLTLVGHSQVSGAVFQPFWKRPHRATPVKCNDQTLSSCLTGVDAFLGFCIAKSFADKAGKVGVLVLRARALLVATLNR